MILFRMEATEVRRMVCFAPSGEASIYMREGELVPIHAGRKFSMVLGMLLGNGHYLATFVWPNGGEFHEEFENEDSFHAMWKRP